MDGFMSFINPLVDAKTNEKEFDDNIELF